MTAGGNGTRRKLAQLILETNMDEYENSPANLIKSTVTSESLTEENLIEYFSASQIHFVISLC